MKYILFILSLFLYYTVLAQDSIECRSYRAIVANPQMNILYIGVDNPLYMSLLGEKSFIAKIDNGKIIEREGYYCVRVTEGTQSTITLYNKKGKAEARYSFRVRILPCPMVTIGGNIEGGEINRNLLLASALIPILKYFEYDAYFTVLSYKALITHTNGEPKIFAVEGNQLSAELKDEIRTLETGNKILFYDIKVQLVKSSNEPCDATPLSLTIK